MTTVAKIVAGRRFHPAALALTIAAIVEAYAYLPISDYHRSIHNLTGIWYQDALIHGIGVVAVITAAALTWAWWRNSGKWLDRGLQLSSFLWIYVTIGTIFEGGVISRVLIGVSLIVLSAGSAWLEEVGDDGS